MDMVGFLLRLKRACQFSRSAAAAVLRNAIATHLRRSWCSGYRGSVVPASRWHCDIDRSIHHVTVYPPMYTRDSHCNKL